MEIIIIIVISAAVAVYTVLPFFLKNGDMEKTDLVIPEFGSLDPAVEKLRSLDNHKEALFAAIREIDFDYGLGKLSKDDFEELKEKYKLEAASVLKEIDLIQNQIETKGPDFELEQEISSYRNKRADNSTEDITIEEEISAFRSANREGDTDSACSKCGSEFKDGDLFCSKCGATLN